MMHNRFWSTLLIFIAAACGTGCKKPITPVYAGYRNLHVERTSFKETVLAANLLLFNPNRFALQVKSADLVLFLNDRTLGHSSIDSLIRLLPEDTTSIRMRITAAPSDLLRTAGQILLNPEVKVRVEGKVRAGRKGFFVNVPINYSGTQRIDLRNDSIAGN